SRHTRTARDRLTAILLTRNGLVRGLQGSIVGGAPALGFFHRDDRIAEMLAAQRVDTARHAQLPVFRTRIFQQQARRAVRKLPNACEWNFTSHGIERLSVFGERLDSNTERSEVNR